MQTQKSPARKHRALRLFAIVRGASIPRMKNLLAPVLAALLFTGCAAIEKAERNDTEQTLAAAGFKIVPANTPQRQQALTALKPYTVHRQIRGDKVLYVYPDDQQNFALIGDQDAYSKYQNLIQQQQISQDNLMAAQMMSMPGVWPGWGYYGY